MSVSHSEQGNLAGQPGQFLPYNAQSDFLLARINDEVAAMTGRDTTAGLVGWDPSVDVGPGGGRFSLAEFMRHPSPTARWRSFLKAVTWRAVGSLDTFILSFLVVYVFGHQQHALAAAKVGGVIALGETATKIALFYCHDRVWAHVPWGRADVEAAPRKPDLSDY